jgi:mandelamide amidase
MLVAEQSGGVAAYRAAMEGGLPALRHHYRALFHSHALDALAFPTTPIVAPLIGADTVITAGGWRPTFQTLIRNTDPGACAGVPGMSLTCGVSREGLPIGLSLDADFGADRRLLGLGLGIEPLFPVPPLPTPSRH